MKPPIGNDVLAAATSWNNKGQALLSEKKYNEAIEAYTKAVALDNANPDYYYNRARVYWNKGDYLSAMGDAKLALTINPKHAGGHYRLGCVLAQQGKYNDAIEAYTNAIALDGASPIYYTQRALAYLDKGDHLSAIRDAESALAINPGYAVAYFRLGCALFKQGRYDKAIEAYTKAIALDGANPDYFSHRALAFASKGNHHFAIKDTNFALAIDPKYAMGYFGLGWVFIRQGKYDEAIEAYTNAIALDSGNPNCYTNRAEAYSCKGDHLSAIKDARSALEINPRFAKGYYRLGCALFNQGQCGEAIEAYTKAIELDGTNADYYWNRARAYSNMGDNLSATKDGKSATAINPKHARGYYQQGWALFSEEKYDEAIEAYTKAIALDSTDPVYYSSRARAHSRKGDHLSAAKDANSALAINPKFNLGYFRLGWALLKQEKYNEAIEAYTNAITIDGANADYYCDRAEAYSGKGDCVTAIEDAKSALEIDPKCHLGYYQLGWALYKLERYDEAIEAYNNAIALDGTKPWYYSERALAYHSKNDNLSAMKDAHAAIALDPKYAMGYIRLGYVLTNQGENDKAIEAYTTAISLDNTDPSYYCDRGLARLGKGDFLSALNDVKSALTISPRLPIGYSSLGWVLYKQGKCDEAIEAYTNAIALNSTDPDFYCDRALVFSEKGDYVFALNDVKSALAINPRHAAAYSRLGWSLYKQKKYDEAIEAYTNAILLNGTNPDFHCDRALVHSSKGDNLSAAKDAKSALAINPKHVMGYSRLGWSLFQQQKYDEAIEVYNTAISLDSANPDFYCDRGLVYSSKGDHLSAANDAKSALVINPKHTSSYAQLGWALLERQKYDEAIEAYTNAIALDGVNPAYYQDRALVYSGKGEHLSAMQDIESALAINPENALSHCRQGFLFGLQGNDDEAAEAYTRAIGLDDSEPDYYSNRAITYSNKGDYPSAINDAKAALAINPKHSLSYCALGWALCKQKKYDEAIEAYTNAIVPNDPSLPASYCDRSLVYLNTGDYPLAIKDAKSALAINPNYAIGYSRLGLALFEQEKYDDAIEAHTNAIALNGANPTYYTDRASAYSCKGDHLSAISDAKSALSINSKHGLSYFHIGWALLERGQCDEAIEAYTNAIALNSNDAIYYSHRALAYSRKGDHLSAMGDAESAIEINPKHCLHLRSIYIPDGKYDEAIEAYTNAIALDNTDPAYYSDRALVYSNKGDFDSAFSDIESALAINPKSALGCYRLGWILFGQGKFQEAIEAYTRAIALDSTNPNYYCSRAIAHSYKGDNLSVINDATSALAINPRHDASLHRLGWALCKQEKYDEAIEAYTKAIALHGTDPVYYSDRAFAYLSKGDYVFAIRDTNTALAINPEHDIGYQRLGRALFQQAKFDEAIDAYTKAIARDGTNPEYYCDRALAYSSKGDHASAVNDAKSALRINPEHDIGYHRLGRALFQQAKFDEAIDAYTNAIVRDGADPDYYCDRALAYSSKGDHVSAINDAKSALEINPKHHIGFLRLGHAHDSSGHFEAAAKAIQRGLEVDPTHADLNSLLAIVQEKLTLDQPISLQQGQDQKVEKALQDLEIIIGKPAETPNSQTNSLDLQMLENRLLRGLRTIAPRAVECISGTRTGILTDVTTMIDDRDGTNVLWIRGAPGSGKSSISLSVKTQLHNHGHLVTYSRFDRDESSCTTSLALWRQVAYDFARLLPSVRMMILQELEDDTVDLNSPFAVFTSLIEKPLSNLTHPHSLVIIIDALDECGGLAGRSSIDRRTLLRTLGRWNQLPKCFKLLVTSREESDIHQVLAPISAPIDIPSGHQIMENPQASTSIHASNDIRTLLEDRFRRVRERNPSLPADWPGSATVTKMIRFAAGNFLWVTTAADFIDWGIDPQDRLGRIMGPASESSGMAPLYFLYTAILETAFGHVAHNSLEGATLRSVLGTMVLAKRSLDDTEYVKILTTMSVTEAILGSIRTGLRSVISPGTDLRFTHKSFDDFLLSEECPDKYRVRMEESHHALTEFCLKTMAEKLHFNMCDLATSWVKNSNVPDIQTRVEDAIPSLLSYSCCFWADHLSLTSFDEPLMGKVKDLILDKLLYWLEAMSLLREVNRVSTSLISLLKWSHPSPDDEFKDFIHDAGRFVAAFGQPIIQSAPHTYISALAFAPEHSSVAKHFLPGFRVLPLSRGKPSNWPSCIFTTEHHNDKVCSIAFSADEKYFVSGSADGTICVCDSDTGNLVSGPLGLAVGRSTVDCVCFDSATRRVWATMGQVAGWDVETGDRHLGFDAGAATSLRCLNGGQKIISVSRRERMVTFWDDATGARLRDIPIEDMVDMVVFSSDGCYMACAGEYDTSIGMWKLLEGNSIEGPLHPRRQLKHKNRISALSFAIDGTFAVSGSIDGTILIWDATTGDTIGGPLATSTEVTAVAYSSQRDILVSTSGDPGTVMVWNVSTHEAIVGPLEGHTSWIRAIALSRDCRRTLTASWDGTVRMWDLGMKGDVLASHANEGHTATVQDLAVSPCGTKLASLDQWTIRVWDVKTGASRLPPISNDSYFSRIIFSPDGNQLVAYSSGNGNLQIMNADTGELVLLQDLSDDGWGRTSIEHVSFSPGGRRLITCSDHDVIRIWSLGEGAMKENLSELRQAVNASKLKPLAFSSDGLTAIMYDTECHVGNIWNTITHRPPPITFVDDKYISGDRVVFSPSGRFFAAAHDDSSKDTLRVWNADTGKLVLGPLPLDGRMNCLALSSDDRHIAFSYSSHPMSAIVVFDIDTDRQASVPKRHNGNITALAFSPDGKTLVSASDDAQIRTWTTTDLFRDSRGSDGSLGIDLHMQDGWVMDAAENLLFWVPKDHRARLLLPGNVSIIGGSGITTEVDLSKFNVGENWTRCFGGGDLRVL